MISFRAGSCRFHYRVGAVILDEEHVLLHRLEGDDFWALPGGRVNPGESAADAISREFVEELGVRVKCNEMLCTGENFFEYQGESHHEIGMYFSVAFPSDSALLEKGRSHLGTEGGRTLEFKWFSLVELPSVDLRPVALKEPLSEGGLPRHFVQRG